MTDERPRIQVLFVGVGGQGVLTATTVLAATAHVAGQPVISGQLHGMSQRGGSVECSVIVGDASSSFLVGAPDIVLAFEALELLRCAHLLGENTQVIVNTTRITPPGVDPRGDEYPSLDDIVARVGQTGATVRVIDGLRLVEQVGETRTLNMLMIGALVELGLLPIAAEQVYEVIAQRCPARFLDANKAAFALGRSEIRQQTTEERTASVHDASGVCA